MRARDTHERHDIRLATEFDIVAEGVPRKRALPPPALLRRHMEPGVEGNPPSIVCIKLQE